MTDLIALQRMTQVIEALDRMHNGLLALIDEHHDLERELNDRIRKLEDNIADVASDVKDLQAK